MCLGIRPQGGRYQHLGRETFLAPVSWTTDNWPVVNGNGTVNLDMKVNTLPQVTVKAVPEREEFNSASPAIYWNFLRNPDMADYSLSDKPGWLKLNGNKYSLDSAASPAFMGRRQQDYNCTVTTKINYSPVAAGQKAGITVIMNNNFHYDLTIIKDKNGKHKVSLDYTIDRIRKTAANVEINDSNLWLSVTADPDNYHFSYSENGSSFHDLGIAPTRLLSSEVAGGFTGVYIGMFAVCPDGAQPVPAYFDWFEYKPN